MIPMVHKIEILRRNPSTSATRPRMIIVPLPVVDHCVLQECPHGGWFNRIHRLLRNGLLNQACARRCRRCPAPRLRRPAGVGPAAAVPRGHSGPAADPGSCTPRGPSTAGPTSSVPTTTRPSATASTRRRSGPLHQRRSAISVVFSARTTGSPVRGERGILGEGCRDCYRPVRRRSQSSTVARVDASAVPRRRCSRRCAMDRRYSGMANDGRSRPPPATRMWWANPRSRVAAGPLPACLDAVAGALRPSRARGAGPPRRGRRSRCPPAPTLTTVASIASGEDGAVPEDDVPTGDVVSEPAASPGVYRLRAVLHAVSPLIWRRLLVSGESTVADLHTIVQTAFGWGEEHLHRFVIHGAEYGINYVGGPGFRDARQVRLGGLGLRVGERFFYEYNFFAGWRVDLRVEEIVAAEPGRVYPRCTAGRRAGPPEGWDGPWAFLDATQPHLVFAATLRAAEIVGQLLDADPDAEPATVGVDRDELTALLPLLGLERFDRRGLNRALADLATTTETKPS